jgi:predicted metal-dependent phosphoesterase TrpH
VCDDHPVTDRRSLLMAGVGVATYAAVATFEPAAAGTRTRSHTFTGSFTGVGTPDWHYLPFKVDKAVTEIRVSYAYEATDTGAGFSANVIDIGLFDGSGHGLGRQAGFRGWSGGARRSFRVSRHSATPGYLPGPLRPGTWHVILGPFTIVPPGVSWKVTVTLVSGRPKSRFRPEPAPRRVEGTGPGWYRGDLHLHTVHSDGRDTQRAMALSARSKGLDFIVSTEHNTTSAHGTWGRHTPRNLLVINGEEITTRAGHWIAAGIPAGAWVDWRYRAENGRLPRFLRRVHDLGGIAIACHPYVPIPGTMWGFGYDFAGMDAVELWNGPWTLDDQFGLEAWHAMLVAGRFVPGVGSSDAHNADDVGRAQTVVHARTLSAGAVIAAVKAGRSWLAESSTVDLSFTASLGATTVSCGGTLAAGPADLVDVRLVVRGAPACLAQVIGPAGPLAGAVTDGSGAATVTVAVPAGLTPFVRAEVRRLDGAPVLNPLQGVAGLAMVAMTNPVFLG